MSKFKIGDKVKIYRKKEDMTFGWSDSMDKYVGETDIISDISGQSIYLKEISWIWHESVLIKIGGSMHEDLKQRIEALDDGWNKEADDLIREIQNHIDNGLGRTIEINIWSNSYKNRVKNGEIEVRIQVSQKRGVFKFDTQCEKMQAFKDALLWLLDHSDISKSLEGTTQKVKIDGKVYEAEIIKEV